MGGMLTDKIHLPGDMEVTPEDILSSSLAVIFPDEWVKFLFFEYFGFAWFFKFLVELLNYWLLCYYVFGWDEGSINIKILLWGVGVSSWVFFCLLRTRLGGLKQMVYLCLAWGG